MAKHATFQDYYDFNPPADHGTGDVWSDLPTHGLLRLPRCTGLVITPACDLANHKVETVTYLPVLPCRLWFSVTAFLPEIRRQIHGQMGPAKIPPESQIPKDAPIEPAALDRLDAAVQALLKDEKGAKERNALERCASAVRQLRRIIIEPALTSDMDDVRCLLAGQWEDFTEKAVTNALRSDVHFLPADRQDVVWSGVPEPSFVLFRYPLTAPIEIFDWAADAEISDWAKHLDGLAKRVPLAAAFKDVRPVKRLRLKLDFLADLLTRYVALYARLGSPDFLPTTIAQYCRDLGARR